MNETSGGQKSKYTYRHMQLMKEQLINQNVLELLLIFSIISLILIYNL